MTSTAVRLPSGTAASSGATPILNRAQGPERQDYLFDLIKGNVEEQGSAQPSSLPKKEPPKTSIATQRRKPAIAFVFFALTADMLS